jgi:hypothetical protein
MKSKKETWWEKEDRLLNRKFIRKIINETMKEHQEITHPPEMSCEVCIENALRKYEEYIKKKVKQCQKKKC